MRLLPPVIRETTSERATWNCTTASLSKKEGAETSRLIVMVPRGSVKGGMVSVRPCSKRPRWMLGDTLHAEAILRAEGGRIVHVDVEVKNQEGTRVAWLTATGFKKSTSWS